MAEKWKEYQEHARRLSDEELADFLSLDDLRAFRDAETGERLISSSDFFKAGYFPGARTDAAVPFRVQEYEERQKAAENPPESDLRRHYYEKLNEKYGEIIAEYPPRPSPHATWNTAISDMLEKGLETSKSSGVAFKNLGGSVYTENVQERGSNMPNVAGVEFDYGPGGQEAAQRYRRSLSPGPGRGFRPLGSRTESNPIIAAANQQIAQNMRRPIRMDEGGSVEARAVAQGLYALTDDKTTTNQQVVDYVINNLKLLTEIAQEQPWVQRVIDGVSAHVAGRDTESEFAAHLEVPVTVDDIAFGATAGAGAALDVPLAGRNRLGIDEAVFGAIAGAGGPLAATGLGRQEALRAAGTESYLYGPSPPSEQFDDTTAIFNQRKEPLRRLERPPEPWEFGGLGVDSPTPQGMAHGGVPRGTVAGELEPRGYLTARQAGETMRERAKGLRGRRNYGGGIGSLYNRYG